VQLGAERLEELFSDEDFIAKANAISPTLKDHFSEGFNVEITTDILADHLIAEYSAGVITIDTRFILQANPFHASTLCHEIAHHYGYTHTDEDYYSSIPYLFGELCRIEYTKKFWYTWGGTILTKKQAINYLERGTL
jgi:hypothetical protein